MHMVVETNRDSKPFVFLYEPFVYFLDFSEHMFDNRSTIEGGGEMEVIKFSPQDTKYEDNGMTKWQGVILSKETNAMKHMTLHNRLVEQEGKVELSEEEVSRWLYLFYIKKAPIRVWANIKNRNESVDKEFECVVEGLSANEICLRLKDSRQVRCRLEKIQYIKEMDPLEWYDVRY